MGGSAQQAWGAAMTEMQQAMTPPELQGRFWPQQQQQPPQQFTPPQMPQGGGAQSNPMLAAQGGTNAMQPQALQQILAVLGGGR